MREVAKDLKPIYTAVDRDHAWAAARALRRDLGSQVPDDLRRAGPSTGSGSSRSWRSRPTSAARSTRPTRSRRSTARSARSSRPAAASPTRTPPASCSTSRSPAHNRNGGTPTTGAQPSPPSASTSATASPTPPDVTANSLSHIDTPKSNWYVNHSAYTESVTPSDRLRQTAQPHTRALQQGGGGGWSQWARGHGVVTSRTDKPSWRDLGRSAGRSARGGGRGRAPGSCRGCLGDHQPGSREDTGWLSSPRHTDRPSRGRLLVS